MTRIREGSGRKLATAAVAALLLAGTAAFTGCRMPGEAPVAAADELGQVDFWVEECRLEVLVGEAVTLTARDRNTAGRDVRIEWMTTGGELTTERNNRLARVQFDNPGTFTITGRMYADDFVVSDSIDIHVRSIR
jgi:hypothetical protein